MTPMSARERLRCGGVGAWVSDRQRGGGLPKGTGIVRISPVSRAPETRVCGSSERAGRVRAERARRIGRRGGHGFPTRRLLTESYKQVLEIEKRAQVFPTQTKSAEVGVGGGHSPVEKNGR